MTQVMTMQEIEEQFDSEWVLIDKPETNEIQEVLRGEVIFHSKDRHAVYQHAKTLPEPLNVAIYYIGEPTEGTIFLI
jgi:hypothetical protein